MYTLELIKEAFGNIVSVILSPLFGLVLIILYIQYKRINKMEMKIRGYVKNSILKKMLRSSLIGIIVSFIGTIIIIACRIYINISDFYIILPLALVLLLINIRYVCFSYSGSIVCLLSLIFYPKINVVSIIALIGILHLVESILIYFDGTYDPIPMVVENNNEISGAFYMQRFWPIPFIILLSSNTLGISCEIFELAGAIAALGYGDMTCAYKPKTKGKIIAKRLFIYSIITIMLALLGRSIYAFRIIGPLFCMFAHEYLIKWSLREEKEMNNLFIPPKEGVLVLDFMNDSIAKELKLEVGDMILEVNGYKVIDEFNLKEILKIKNYGFYMIIERNKRIIKLSINKSVSKIGAFVISRNSNNIMEMSSNYSILRKIKNKYFYNKKQKTT